MASCKEIRSFTGNSVLPTDDFRGPVGTMITAELKSSRSGRLEHPEGGEHTGSTVTGEQWSSTLHPQIGSFAGSASFSVGKCIRDPDHQLTTDAQEIY